MPQDHIASQKIRTLLNESPFQNDVKQSAPGFYIHAYTRTHARACRHRCKPGSPVLIYKQESHQYRGSKELIVEQLQWAFPRYVSLSTTHWGKGLEGNWNTVGERGSEQGEGGSEQ